MGGEAALDSRQRSQVGLIKPALVSIAFLIFLLLLVKGVSAISSMDVTYGAEGRFVVESCSAVERQIVCEGLLTPEGQLESVGSTMVGPRSTFGSETPRRGAEIEAYYRVVEPAQSFPERGRGAELARLFLGIIPLLFLVGGLASWLVGWLLTKGIPRAEAERTADHYRFPARFVLRPRGLLWACVGFVWYVADAKFVDQLLGSAGLG